jgi:hypothetical protein
VKLVLLKAKGEQRIYVQKVDDGNSVSISATC